HISLCVEASEASLVVNELNMIFLSDDLSSGLFPQRHATGVIAMTMCQDDVLDRAFVFGGEKLVMLASVQHHRRVDDHITFRSRDHQGIAKALDHADSFVNPDDLLADPEECRRVVRA